MDATYAFEIELELEAFVEPYRPASYAGPAEGGEIADLDIRDLDIRDACALTYEPARKTWNRKSFLDGVDRKNPEVRKLLDNLLELVREDAEQAIIDATLESAA